MRLAIIQDGPVYNDLQATIKKTISLMHEAARDGAQLIVFGECWLSGYPIWLDIGRDVNLWESKAVKSVWSRMYQNSPVIDGPEITQICRYARELGVYVVIGLNETIAKGRARGTIFNTVITINAEGEMVNHHRKLMPTYTERLVHGLGDGAGLRTVSTPFGHIGTLICWEHWMPLSRQAMHDAGEDIHIALWPMVKEMNHVACRHYAFEGRCIVVAVGQIMHVNEFPSELSISPDIDIPDSQLLMRGGSAVYDSQGQFILPQTYENRGIIIIEINTDSIIPDKMNLDVSGHYQRSDVFSLKVDKHRQVD